MANKWPTLQEYNEAVQNPRIAFADAELQGGAGRTHTTWVAQANHRGLR